MAAALDTAAAAASPGAAADLDVAAIESRVERSLVTRIQKLVDDFPERTIDVVRGWLAEDRR